MGKVKAAVRRGFKPINTLQRAYKRMLKRLKYQDGSIFNTGELFPTKANINGGLNLTDREDIHGERVAALKRKQLV
jgi:hypothetical protein